MQKKNKNCGFVYMETLFFYIIKSSLQIIYIYIAITHIKVENYNSALDNFHYKQFFRNYIFNLFGEIKLNLLYIKVFIFIFKNNLNILY